MTHNPHIPANVCPACGCAFTSAFRRASHASAAPPDSPCHVPDERLTPAVPPPQLDPHERERLGIIQERSARRAMLYRNHPENTEPRKRSRFFSFLAKLFRG